MKQEGGQRWPSRGGRVLTLSSYNRDPIKTLRGGLDVKYWRLMAVGGVFSRTSRRDKALIRYGRSCGRFRNHHGQSNSGCGRSLFSST